MECLKACCDRMHLDDYVEAGVQLAATGAGGAAGIGGSSVDGSGSRAPNTGGSSSSVPGGMPSAASQQGDGGCEGAALDWMPSRLPLPLLSFVLTQVCKLIPCMAGGGWLLVLGVG